MFITCRGHFVRKPLSPVNGWVNVGLCYSVLMVINAFVIYKRRVYKNKIYHEIMILTVLIPNQLRDYFQKKFNLSKTNIKKCTTTTY